MTSRSAYPSDLSDARWAVIEPRLTAWRSPVPPPASAAARLPMISARSSTRSCISTRTGIPWRYLPHDFPPYRTVYGYFAAWSKEGLFTDLNYATSPVRDHHGRQIEPTASIMDTQSVKTSTLGLLLAVVVTAASVSDNVIRMNLLDQATAAHPTPGPRRSLDSS